MSDFHLLVRGIDLDHLVNDLKDSPMNWQEDKGKKLNKGNKTYSRRLIQYNGNFQDQYIMLPSLSMV